MMNINIIRSYFPSSLRNNAAFDKYMLKEYLQLMILDYISSSKYASKLCFIGGTNLRLIHGIDRFSEDLDFDCKNLSKEDFIKMTDGIIAFLGGNDLQVESRDKENTRLAAFRRNLYFPELLFKMNLSGHKEERFLIKIEAQDQGVNYKTEIADIRDCGYFFPIKVPPTSVLCAMKLSALLTRAKGRDFYDSMFLLSLTEPDYNFLKERSGIKSKAELKVALEKKLQEVDLAKKSKDFEHLLFNSVNHSKILRFPEFVKSL